jgi:hypothetical protein
VPTQRALNSGSVQSPAARRVNTMSLTSSETCSHAGRDPIRLFTKEVVTVDQVEVD